MMNRCYYKRLYHRGGFIDYGVKPRLTVIFVHTAVVFNMTTYGVHNVRTCLSRLLADIM